MTIKELYHSLLNDGNASQQAVRLLEQTHWFTTNAEFDPRSGAALPQSLSSFLAKIANPTKFTDLHDRVWRIADHARDSLHHLFLSLNENPCREQALMPIRNVRELDANCFIKLSNRPGRNIREKLAGKPYLQAVRHYQSVDLPENRLLKEFSIQLVELLEMKSRNLGTQEDSLVQLIRNWLHSDEATSISRWDNTPPNNTLLSHRDYRRIWDAWRWMQALDDDIDNDLLHLAERQKTMDFWNDMECISTSQNASIADIPLLFDYDNFRIDLFEKNKIHILTDRSFTISKATDIQQVNIHGNRERNETIKTSDLVCIDLTDINPSFASEKSKGNLSINLIWQNWASDSEDVDIPLFDASAVWLHNCATTIKSSDLFSQNSIPRDLLERASRSFVSQIKKCFLNDIIIWLIPDYSNDFELELLRRNINFAYPFAEPLPRSISAVMENIEYSSIPRDGYRVAVLDKCNGISTVTLMVARFSEALKKQVPHTRGYCWERHTTVKIVSEDISTQDSNVSIVTFEHNGNWLRPIKYSKVKSYSVKDLHAITGWEEIDKCITVSNAPVLGGLKVHLIQSSAKEVPIWRDYLPDLAMVLSANGVFPLVNNMSIAPLRGEVINLDIPTKFVLEAGKKYYQFPLIKGNGKDEFHYTAYLHSKDFPLQTDTICNLKMTYEYGANDPYQLKFVSEKTIDGKRLVIWAEWRLLNNDSIDPSTLPIPELPPPRTWQELQTITGKDGEVFDILEDFVHKVYFSKIIEKYIEACTTDSSKFEIQKARLSFCWWAQTYEDKYYFWAEDEESNMVFCSSERVDESFNIHSMSRGNVIYANVKRFQPRETLTITKVSRDKNGNLFCLAKSNEGKTVFCHSSSFIERISLNQLRIGVNIYGNIRQDKKDKDRFLANMITMQYGNDYPFAFAISTEKISAKEKEYIDGKVKRERIHKFSEWYTQLSSVRSMILKLRYDYLTIWNAGRTVDNNSEIPSDIRDSILDEIEAAYKLYRFLDSPKIRDFISKLSSNDSVKHKQSINVDVIRARILDFLSALNGNTPSDIPLELFSILEEPNKFIYNNRAIAFALGTVELPWQKELLNRFISFKPKDPRLISIKLEDWSIIFWRSLDIIDTLSYESLLSIIQDLSMTLHSEIEALKTKPDDEYIPQRIGRHLDLLLALFRVRRSPDEMTRRLLLPLNKYSIDFMNLLTEFLKLKIPLVTYSITLKMEKTSASAALPDIIYALQLYLSGDNGANSIQIVSNDEND